jgi:hypothetical protein
VQGEVKHEVVVLLQQQQQQQQTTFILAKVRMLVNEELNMYPNFLGPCVKHADIKEEDYSQETEHNKISRANNYQFTRERQE